MIVTQTFRHLFDGLNKPIESKETFALFAETEKMAEEQIGYGYQEKNEKKKTTKEHKKRL